MGISQQDQMWSSRSYSRVILNCYSVLVSSTVQKHNCVSDVQVHMCIFLFNLFRHDSVVQASLLANTPLQSLVTTPMTWNLMFSLQTYSEVSPCLKKQCLVNTGVLQGTVPSCPVFSSTDNELRAECQSSSPIPDSPAHEVSLNSAVYFGMY